MIQNHNGSHCKLDNAPTTSNEQDEVRDGGESMTTQ